jgi:hypothetical protein
MSTDHYRKELTRIIAGRKWISASDVLIASYRRAEFLEELGAENVFRLGASRGAGDLNEVPDTLSHMMNTPEHASTMQNIRAAMQSFKDLDPVARAKIDAWDPAHSAKAITTIFSDDQPIHGRPVWGARLPEWKPSVVTHRRILPARGRVCSTIRRRDCSSDRRIVGTRP